MAGDRSNPREIRVPPIPSRKHRRRQRQCEIMSRNKGKGGKNKKRGQNEADDEKIELVFKEDDQEYTQVLLMLGNGRCEDMCIDNTKCSCIIRGKMNKIGSPPMILSCSVFAIISG